MAEAASGVSMGSTDTRSVQVMLSMCDGSHRRDRLAGVDSARSRTRTAASVFSPDDEKGSKMELKLISTRPVSLGENRVYECGGRRISVSLIDGWFEFLVDGNRVIKLIPDRGPLTWERVARAGLAYTQ
jgi:hypothetical protein